MVIIDILIYIIFAWVMCNFVKKSTNYNPDSVKIDKYLWYFIFFFTIISAIRWNVGVDSIDYAHSFVKGETEHEFLSSFQDVEEKEWLNVLLVHGVHDLGLHFTIGMGIYAFLQIFFITTACKEYKYILLFVPILLFGSSYYLDLMNGIRQMIVACGLVWASRFIVERKPIHYFAFVAIAYFMHSSSLVLLPLYFIPNGFSIANKRLLSLIIYTACFIIGMTPQFKNVVGYAESLTLLLGYNTYSDRVTDFLTTGYAEEVRAMGPMQLSYLLIGYVIIWFGPTLKKIYENKIPHFNLWYLFAVFYGCAYFLVCNVSHIFIRPITYFLMFQMLIGALVLHFLSTECARKTSYSMIKRLFILIIWTSIVWNVVKTDVLLEPYMRKQESVTYKVFFMHFDEVNKLR